MKQYVFVVKVVSKAQWHVQAETLEDAEEQFNALHEAGEPPVEEDVEDSEIVSVLEDGVPVAPPSKKRYHAEVEEVSAGEAGAVEKAWRFHLDVVGYGEDPEEAWGNLLLYSLKEAPPCERVPDQDVRLENKNEKGATG